MQKPIFSNGSQWAQTASAGATPASGQEMLKDCPHRYIFTCPPAQVPETDFEQCRPMCCFLSLSVASGCLWLPLVASHGCLRLPMASSGLLWHLVAPCGCLWPPSWLYPSTMSDGGVGEAHTTMRTLLGVSCQWHGILGGWDCIAPLVGSTRMEVSCVDRPKLNLKPKP